jgi:predicted CDP-diglyceride synthetase/phosphatidate cytidylyltransferase
MSRGRPIRQCGLASAHFRRFPACDVLQYVFGKTLGKRRIVPLVSPNKTWGGALDGIAGGQPGGAVL